jgi:SPP1 gp7 family putative phage head morphogenesis protein
MFRGKPLNYNAGIQDRYVKELTGLVVQMTKQTSREIERLFKKEMPGIAMDASISSQARILTNQLKIKFESLFGRKAKLLADRMVNSQDKTSKSNLYGSLKELSGGLSVKTDITNSTLKDVIKASITENVSLITNIATEYIDQITGSTMRAITTGGGLPDIRDELMKREGMTIRRAKNIALDQTRKAYSSINKVRMESVGIKKFEWVHSGGGQHPRKLHQEMNGNIYSFSEPPVIDDSTGQRGLPGVAINCRCTLIPVIEFENDNE